MIRSFGDPSTQDIFDGFNTKGARKNLNPALHPVARRKLDMLNAAASLNDLKVPPSNHLEALKGNLKGWYSIRINGQYRIIFRWIEEYADEVKIVDYH